MAFSIDSPEVRMAEAVMEVGRRWEWEADLNESIVPNQMEISVDGQPVGYLDTRDYRIVEFSND